MSKKVKVIIVGTAILIVMVAVLIILHYSQPMQKTPEHLDSWVAKETQELNVLPSASGTVSEEADASLEKQARESHIENEEVTKQGETNSSENIEEAITWLESLETEISTEEKKPAEILKKYIEITNSPEFQMELRNILVTSRKEQLAYMRKVKELENKLKNSSATERDNIQNDLWEAKVDLRKEIILQTDDVHRLYLRHFTADELSIARQEIKKTSSPPPFFEASAGDPHEQTALRDEAMRRLKKNGWVPAMLDGAY